MTTEGPESEVTPNKSGLHVSWRAIFQLLAWVAPLAATGAIIYLSTVFVTQAQMRDAIEPLEAIPGRVERLEEFRREHRIEQANSNASIGAIQQDMAGIKAELRSLQKESEKNTDRILQRLDSIQSKR